MRDDAQIEGAQGPHPLATELATRLEPGDRVLMLGGRSQRSLAAFERRGITVERVSAGTLGDLNARRAFDGILSTHELLHGTRADVTALVGDLAGRLAPDGLFYATFGSTADPRCGAGTWIPGDGWAPVDGDEAGVTHAYFDRSALERVLAIFAEAEFEERDVRAIVGRWAHSGTGEGHPSMHWFARARAR